MGLDDYEQMTGLTVKDADRGFVTANITKARIAIESAVGFPLLAEAAGENLYTERGIAPSDNWVCGWSDADLLPADNEPDAVYRLFDLRNTHELVYIDPCTAITKVKLVHGDVTIDTFGSDEYSLLKLGGYGQLLDLMPNVARIYDHYGCNHALQIAVWATWLGLEDDADDDATVNLPDDLMVLWADQAAHLSDRSRLVKSESRGTRSYTKAEVKSPLDLSAAILSKYAGPHGTAGRLPV